MLAAIKNGDAIQVSEADQAYYERIRAMLGADEAVEEATAKGEEGT